MIASRIVAFFLLPLTFGIVAAAPALNDDSTLTKRASPADVKGVLDTLKQSTDSFTSEINNQVNSGNPTQSSLEPVFNDLKTALDTASSSLSAIQGPVSTTGDPSVEEIGELVAGIIQDVANAINLVKDVAGVDALIGSIGIALNQVLFGLGVLLAGVLAVVANLLRGVAGLLNSLGLGLLLGTIGLGL